ncbi:hypothetical protein BCI9360_03508 [Bacillus sp. CECT 9360]|nr:hypothetical protein BCI9360_03508 [Bacillus sp. CECT 9360]
MNSSYDPEGPSQSGEANFIHDLIAVKVSTRKR